jgi:aminoglycoside 3-N-acetyltransferase
MVRGESSVNPVQVTKRDIVSGLYELGLAPGSGVMVHSSLRSFGHVEGGARTVVEALMEVVSSSGTLMMPSFNHGAAFAPGAPGYFSPMKTPSTNGAIPDLFWRMSGVSRSLNPTHSFAAWGRRSVEYTAHHHRTLTMGPESPLGLLLADDGWGLLLGVGYGANTFHHVVEMSGGAPCLGRRIEAYPMILPDGRWVEGRTWGFRAQACPFTDRNRYAPEMAVRSVERVGHVGESRVRLFRLRDCYQVVAQLLSQGAETLVPCSRCKIRPLRGKWTAPSDWDERNQALLPDSPAWTY